MNVQCRGLVLVRLTIGTSIWHSGPLAKRRRGPQTSAAIITMRSFVQRGCCVMQRLAMRY
eukprot:3892910-Pleurochrysis_carterae.AAC.1